MRGDDKGKKEGRRGKEGKKRSRSRKEGKDSMTSMNAIDPISSCSNKEISHQKKERRNRKWERMKLCQSRGVY